MSNLGDKIRKYGDTLDKTSRHPGHYDSAQSTAKQVEALEYSNQLLRVQLRTMKTNLDNLLEQRGERHVVKVTQVRDWLDTILK